MKYEKYLPLGSVVLLKGGKKRLMITGFYITTNENDKVYDYTGCLYPEGMLTSESNCVFNHDQIERIFCLGYSDEEEKKFKEELKKMTSK